jgi:hypothetical protein
MNRYEWHCAIHGHFTVGPTGKPMRCLRCGTQLDDMGLDPRLDRRKDES